MARLGPYEPHPRVAVAVSGGGDSMALAHLAAAWTRARGGEAVALTVDHGLRPEAADEAAWVGARMRALGLPHFVSRPWEVPPASGIQAWARSVRRALLAAWCRDHGVIHLLLAHQREDQAETHLMRRARGDGPGAAAMAPIVARDGVRVLRPLLDVARFSLRAYLRARGIEWLEDPSNVDARFERARLRRRMTPGEADMALGRAAAAAASRGMMEGETARAAALVLSPAPAGFCLLDRVLFAPLPRAIRRALLARVAASVGERAWPPRRERVERLDSAIAGGDLGRGRTLAGCRVLPWRERILICREHRRATLPPAIAISDDGPVRWDRFQARLIGLAGRCCELRLGALGRANPGTGRERARVPAPARASLPALYDANGPLIVPHLGFRRADAGALRLEIELEPRNPIVAWPFPVTGTACDPRSGAPDCADE